MLIFYMIKVQKVFTEFGFCGAIMRASQDGQLPAASFVNMFALSAFRKERKKLCIRRYDYEESEEGNGSPYGIPGSLYGQLHGIHGSRQTLIWNSTFLLFRRCFCEAFHSESDRIHGSVCCVHGSRWPLTQGNRHCHFKFRRCPLEMTVFFFMRIRSRHENSKIKKNFVHIQTQFVHSKTENYLL